MADADKVTGLTPMTTSKSFFRLLLNLFADILVLVDDIQVVLLIDNFEMLCIFLESVV